MSAPIPNFNLNTVTPSNAANEFGGNFVDLNGIQSGTVNVGGSPFSNVAVIGALALVAVVYLVARR